LCIESLDQPYDESESETSSLMHMSNALVETSPVLRMEQDALRDAELSTGQLSMLLGCVADNIIEDERFSSLDLQVMRALLVLQRREPRLQSRALSWLRCEQLSSHDRQMLGGVPGRDDPEKMLADLGQIMNRVQGLALVVCIDQIEEIHNMDDSGQRFRRAMQTVCRLAERVPSSLFVVSCLEDLYSDLRRSLTRSTADRIEKADPTPVSLEARRSLDEIKTLVSQRLQFLYSELDVEFDDSDPAFPIPQAALAALANQRSRDVLLWCGEFRRRCVAAGRIVESDSEDMVAGDSGKPLNPEAGGHTAEPVVIGGGTAAESTAAETTTSGPAQGSVDVIQFEQLWNDFRAGWNEPAPDEDSRQCELLAWSIGRCGDELTTGHHFSTESDDWTIAVEVEAHDTSVELLLIGLCNKPPQGGGLTKQVTALQKIAGEHRIVVARSAEFPKTARSKIALQLGELVGRGGRKVLVEDSDWRLMGAFREFHDQSSSRIGFDDWLHSECPLTRLKSLRRILDLDRLKPRAVPSSKQGAPVEQTAEPVSDSSDVPKTQATSSVTSNALSGTEDSMEIGTSAGLSGTPVTLQPIDLKTHAAFLGGSGSGKTTLALCLIEQLLMRHVPVVLIDRKGDLGGYADPAFWTKAISGGQSDLRERLKAAADVWLYTPGHPEGNPLAIPLIPEGLHEMTSFEQRTLAQHASNALGSMMAMKRTGPDGPRMAVLDQAIRLVAEVTESKATLDQLIDFVAEPDPLLSSELGRLDQKLLKKLVDNLWTLRSTRGHLLEASGPVLSIDSMVQPRAGRVPLSVINTKFLTDNAGIEFWVSQFLMTLARWTSCHPSDELQLAVLFDEADMYLPAQRQPATKPLMEDLLKRARSAGISVLLATQSPGDLDYKCRDNIRTWFVGRVKEKTALDKLKPMLAECRTDISSKLPGQQTGEFHMLQDGVVTPFHARRSLLETRQLSEQETLDLAYDGRLTN
jgi:hypothetical protein